MTHLLLLLTAAPWAVQTAPVLEEPWAISDAVAIDESSVGLIARRDDLGAVYVAQPPQKPRSVLSREVQLVPGMGFSVAASQDGGVAMFDVVSQPEPRARPVTMLERLPRAFACASSSEACAWVEGKKLVFASGETRNELTWSDPAPAEQPSPFAAPKKIAPESEKKRPGPKTIELETVENLGVSPDALLIALKFRQLAGLVSIDGAQAWVVFADVMGQGRSLPEAWADLQARLAKMPKSNLARREGCTLQLERWSPPHTLEVFIDQSPDVGAPDCGTRGARSIGRGDGPAEPWAWATKECGWFNSNGASLTNSCSFLNDGVFSGPLLPFSLALSPVELLIDLTQSTDEAEGWSYAPPSRQKPFTRVRGSPRVNDEKPNEWTIVTFGPQRPGLQRLAVPEFEDMPELVLSLTSGWHLFKGRVRSNEASGDAWRWLKFDKVVKR
jgi:hypothetical protein